MITKEFLNNPNATNILGIEDIDTTDFILSLYDPYDIDISDAIAFLKKNISIKTPLEELALKFIAHNFQYYAQKHDTIAYDLGIDNVYDKILDHSVLGYYALLKEFLPPFTDDWVLKQTVTYNPLNNSCEEKDLWVSKRMSITLKWETGASVLATIICNKFDQCISSINKRLYKKLEKKELALFFDIEEFEKSSGYRDYRSLKDMLLS